MRVLAAAIVNRRIFYTSEVGKELGAAGKNQELKFQDYG
jgi:hypothetical protein